MMAEAPPSFERRATALTIAALAAVVEISVVSLGTEVLSRLVYRVDSGIGTMLTLIPVYLFVGAIIAVPLCLAIGLPLWHLAVRSGRQSRRDAMRFGLAAGTVIGVFVAILLNEGSGMTFTPTALSMILLFCFAGMSTAWIAHRIGYRE